MKSIHKMELNEFLEVSNTLHVFRVPGGWIYRFFESYQRRENDGDWSENFIPNSVFIPYNDEFKNVKFDDESFIL